MGREMAEPARKTFTLSTAIADRDTFLQSGAAAEVADRKLEALGLPLNDLTSASVLFFGVAWELANAQRSMPRSNARWFGWSTPN